MLETLTEAGSQCTPAPRAYRSIVTSLAEPAIDGECSSDEGVLVEEDVSCFGCGKELGVGHSVTLPRMGRTFHQACFSCANCGKGFRAVPGDRTFVESGGMPYHIPVRPSPARRLNPILTTLAVRPFSLSPDLFSPPASPHVHLPRPPSPTSSRPPNPHPPPSLNPPSNNLRHPSPPPREPRWAPHLRRLFRPRNGAGDRERPAGEEVPREVLGVWGLWEGGGWGE